MVQREEPEGIEKGVLQYFVDKDGIERLFENFEVAKLELNENEVEEKLRSRWIIIATAK
jgi:hypothetical protein